jgi:hypothetical protein
MIKQLSLFLMLTSVVMLRAQGDATTENNSLEWNEFYRLTWEDFQGTPEENSAGDAATSVQIKAKPYMVKDKVRYDVSALFSKDKSWKRDLSPQLLSHEQLHFDLGELYARKIWKLILEMTSQGVKDVKAINKAVHQLLEESNEADRQYDIETLHGALDQKQAEWSKKIKAELGSLKKFKKPKHIVTAKN